MMIPLKCLFVVRLMKCYIHVDSYKDGIVLDFLILQNILLFRMAIQKYTDTGISLYHGYIERAIPCDISTYGDNINAITFSLSCSFTHSLRRQHIKP